MRYGPLETLVRVAPLLLTCCSTIMTGTTETISITSEPAGATVKILPTGDSAVTPAEVQLSKRYSYLLRAQLDCHDEGRARIENSVHGWMWGNILIGGAIGLLVDVTSGGGFNLEPEEIHFGLVENDQCEGHSDLGAEETEAEADDG